MPRPTEQPDDFKPPLLWLLIAAFWGVAAWQLHTRVEPYFDFDGLESLPAVLAGGLAVWSVMRSIRDQYRLRKHRSQSRRFQETGEQRSTRWAKTADLEASKLLNNVEGMLFGRTRNGKRARYWFSASDVHTAIIAAPGGQKTMSFLVPTILAAAARIIEGVRKVVEHENFLVHDPTAEIWCLTRGALEKAGYTIVLLTAYGAEVMRLTGEELVDAGFDLFSAITDDLSLGELRNELTEAMIRLMPGRVEMDEKSEYFYRYGRMFGMWLYLHVRVMGHRPTLPLMRHVITQGAEELQNSFMSALHHHEDEEGVYDSPVTELYVELSKTLLGMRRTAPEQYAGAQGICEVALDFADLNSDTGEHLSRLTAFDPRDLKDPSKKLAVFVIGSMSKPETSRQLAAMTLTHCFDQIAAVNSPQVVRALVDEASSLNMPKLVDGLEYLRKFRLFITLVLQSDAQMTKRYGAHGRRQVLASCMVKVFAAVVEPETLEMASKLCGETAQIEANLTDRTSGGEALPEVNEGLSYKTRRLIEPHELRVMDEEECLLVVGNLLAMKLEKAPYWTTPWAKLAGHSPYYHGDQTA